MKEKVKICRYCKEEIKKGAKNCPHCSKYQGLSNSAGCSVLILIILLILGVRACSSVQDGYENAKSSSEVKATNEIEISEKNSIYISYEEFVSIENGMTYNEVVQIIGSNGELLSESEFDGVNSTIFVWYGDAYSGANANIYFENGVVTSKAQYGLS